MSYQLIIFPNPLDAHCELTHDDLGGDARMIAVSVVHPSGRLGQAFTLPTTLPLKPGQMIPDPLPNCHGARLRITAPGKVPVDDRGRVFLNDGALPYPWTPGQSAAWEGDDFLLADLATSQPLPRLVRNGLFLAQEVEP